MSPTFTPIGATLTYGQRGAAPSVLGYEVGGLDLSSGVDDATFRGLTDRLHQAGLLVFRGQDLDEESQLKLGARLGRFANHVPEDKAGLISYFDSTKEGSVGQGELLWHSDYGWLPHPLKYIMNFGVKVVSQGGQTMFVSAADAVDRMPNELVEELSACSVRNTSPRSGESVVRSAIETHWASSRRYLTIDRTLTEEVVASSPARGNELLYIAFGYMYDAAFIVRHTWAEGDLVIWDNRLLHHARAPFPGNEHRLLRRCAIADDNDPEGIEYAA
jgi:alpha-ketoglutarate-dependent taurine dioxygenase